MLSKIQVVGKSMPKGKEYRPLGLQPKKTCAMGCQLNKHEDNLKTKKQQRI
ncbi:unnamed protein product [Nyctereutes procyonoides]|uniref:(raccoon dog) hypothetical protein n=1 Tax=Nyctereutes procyonoides TaxID=34880 RepID=A0A811YL81_NYCPR|nr:unnamed protein product [Nyctereutes procyonoides]